ncbi:MULTISPECIES: HopJ type III effector protein [Psychromonas]|uniref:HopJ type III effector protein n=1 Tax=Psychromonas TaxID=67572 RepID=UPI0003FF288A|nr:MULTISPECIES: HopJ type III effector protein [Psychromonas]MBB1272930.1 HopJ type III effector protein [Psychromonas sp. SR45-3]
MTLQDFIAKLNTQPEQVEFADTMAVIEANYAFTETSFSNGLQVNAEGENSGSCKVFSFAQLNKLTEAQTLACFGIYYRNDVLENPEASDHQNIRQFMLNGWSGIHFDAVALNPL